MEKIAERQSKLPKIHGISKINHHLRLQLGLNCSEYVLAELMFELVQKKEEVMASTIYRRVGFAQGEQLHYLNSLIQKGIVLPTESKNPIFTDKWRDVFITKEEEFTEFWTINGKVCWPGSKPKAMQLYTQIRRMYSKEYILEQRDAYFKYLELVNKHQFDRSKMMATVFLGSQERIHEDWKEQVDQLILKYEKKDPVVEPSKMTSQTKNSLYNENSD